MLEDLILTVEREANAQSAEVLRLWLLKLETEFSQQEYLRCALHDSNEIARSLALLQRFDSLRLLILTAHPKSLITASDLPLLLETLKQSISSAEDGSTFRMNKPQFLGALTQIIEELKDLRFYCDDADDHEYMVLSDILIPALELYQYMSCA